MAGTFKLTDHFRRHPIFEPFGHILALVEVTNSIPIDFDLGFLHSVFKNLVSDLWEQSLNVAKVNSVILFEQSNDVGLAAFFNKILKVAGLGVVNLQFWLDLTYRV